MESMKQSASENGCLKVRRALETIKFEERYKILSQSTIRSDLTYEERLLFIDKDDVFELLRKMGYVPKFDKRERFFYTQEKIGRYEFCAVFTLSGGVIDLLWRVSENGELLFEEPCGWIVESVFEKEYVVDNPVFYDYEELEDILKSCFELYEDFKKAMAES